MKQISLFLLFFAITFTACDTTKDNGVTVTLSENSFDKMGLKTNLISKTISVTNPSDAAVDISWVSNTSLPNGWTLSVNSSSTSNGTLNIPANQSIDVTLSVDPSSIVGTGDGTIEFFDGTNEEGTKVIFSFTIEAVEQLYTLVVPGNLNSSAKANNTFDHHIYVYNPNSQPVELKWRKVEGASNPAQWQIAICTDTDCYAPFVFYQTITVNPMDSVDFKCTFDPQSTLGSGSIDALFFMESDSANTLQSRTILHQAT